MIDINTPAPDFTLPADNGGEITLGNLRPAPVVLFFYPRDDTKGCTIEANDFTRLKQEFDTIGARVFGISKDSIASHCKFRDKYELSVALLSDEDGQTCEDYGVWKEKNMYGKTFMGIERSTFLIDANGAVARVWRKVKVAGHGDDVLQAVKAL